jgi:hypothetical protein
MMQAPFSRYAGVILVAAACLLGGCSTRSISNSGYDQSNASWYGGTSHNPFYRGELTELDVLGIDPSEKVDDAKIADTLAAARAGAETVVCYWGILESGVDREGTKAVSWVPIVGTFIPDETQHMRIRLKLAVIDVRSGDWAVLAPDSQSDSALSATLNRGASDQRQVMALKDAAYKAAAAQLVASYAP